MITADQADYVVTLLRESEELLQLRPCEGCPCDGCQPRIAGRRELRLDLHQAAADLDTLARHARAVAAVGCRVVDCPGCHPAEARKSNVTAPPRNADPGPAARGVDPSAFNLGHPVPPQPHTQNTYTSNPDAPVAELQVADTEESRS